MNSKVLILLTFTLTLAMKDWTHTIKQLPDGLLVKKMDTLQQTTAKWTVIITIDKPHQNIELLSTMERYIKSLEIIEPIYRTFFKTIMGKVMGITTPHIHIIQTITNTVKRLMYKLRRNITPIERKKRGLINVVGKISKALFGTAEDEEVQMIKQLVNKNQERKERIIHVVEIMTTIVNQTRMFVIKNREHISNLEFYMDIFSKKMVYF